MSPKEKADELYHYYFNLLEPYIEIPYEEFNTNRVKRCALIVVDEIINEVQHGKRIDWLHNRIGGEDFVNYWNEVKSILNAL